MGQRHAKQIVEDSVQEFCHAARRHSKLLNKKKAQVRFVSSSSLLVRTVVVQKVLDVIRIGLPEFDKSNVDISMGRVDFAIAITEKYGLKSGHRSWKGARRIRHRNPQKGLPKRRRSS